MTQPKQAEVALVSGTTGQDGAYLVGLLLDKGYEVHDIERCTSLAGSMSPDHHE